MYYSTKKFAGDFDEIVSNLKELLKENGFSIITEIPMHEKFNEKLNVDYPRYLILGPCNPKFAFEAVEKEKNIGLFLPCKWVVYESGSDTVVSFVKPTVLINVSGNKELREFGEKIAALFKDILAKL